MKIIDYFGSSDKALWLEQIGRSDWRAGTYLHDILADGSYKDVLGEGTRLFLLTECDTLIAFCTYAEQDSIDDPSLSPWAGFVYTFPQHRGKRRMGKLLEHAYLTAKAEGREYLYICTGEKGLYEKYGFTFYKTMTNIYDEEEDVFRIRIDNKDYGDILGTEVSGTIDRPLGLPHPKCPSMIYPVNYGYVDGIQGGDGEEQDAYVLGTDQPLSKFTGKVIAVISRINDCEDKWVVTVDGSIPSREEIMKSVEFCEQYYMGELYMLSPKG